MPALVIENRHGRRFDELDALKLHVFATSECKGSFVVTGRDGVGLCGMHVPDTPTVTFVAPEWAVATSDH